MSSRPTAIDLFAGAGGLSTGLSRAGFDVQLAVDNTQHCRDTYEQNHPGVDFVCTDIREIAPAMLPVGGKDVDLVAGGPPCPTFSRMGRGQITGDRAKQPGDGHQRGERNGSDTFVDRRKPVDTDRVFADDRHHLFEEFLRFVDVLQPRFVLMENVPGMRSAETCNGANVVERVKRELREAGYRVSVQILNAADYGVPQHRERLFILGNRLDNDNPVMADWTTHRKPRREDEKELKTVRQRDDTQATLERWGLEAEGSFGSFEQDRDRREPWVTVGDAILDLPPVSPDGAMPPKCATEYTIPAVSEYQEWVRNIPDQTDWREVELHNHECRGHNLTDLTLYKLLGEGVGWVIDEIDHDFHPYRSDVFQDQYKKENPREPASTVNAHIQKDGHMSIHPREARSFTVREAARLQSFRDTFRFPVSRSQAFTQVGNAVPPLLAEALGTAIKTVMKK